MTETTGEKPIKSAMVGSDALTDQLQPLLVALDAAVHLLDDAVEIEYEDGRRRCNFEFARVLDFIRISRDAGRRLVPLQPRFTLDDIEGALQLLQESRKGGAGS